VFPGWVLGGAKGRPLFWYDEFAIAYYQRPRKLPFMMSGRSNAKAPRGAFRPLLAGALLLAVAAAQSAAQPLIRHTDLQAVDENGLSAWDGPLPFRIRGVILNNPEERLDPTARFIPWDNGAGVFQLGGQWEIFIQAVDPGDRGGTACWMGQNYGNLPWLHSSDLSYSDAAWEAEMARLNHDPATGRQFRAGDLVEALARRSLFYGGKRNVNEAHDISPEADFELILVQADYGLPEPELVWLKDLVRPDDGDPDTHEDIFDPTRATGGEHWQGMLVCLRDVRLADASGWNQEAWDARRCVVTDGEGRFFPIRMPRRDMGPAPEGTFSPIGILDQNASGSDGTFGYELFVIALAPRLSVQVGADGEAILSWPKSARYFGLEACSSLEEGDWQPAGLSPEEKADRWEVRIEPEAARRFYRLRWTGR